MYLRLSNSRMQCILRLIVYTVNSHPLLFGCRRDFRMNAIKMIAAIMAMPTSTQLAIEHNQPQGTMPIELPF